jgi:hypothetical protein
LVLPFTTIILILELTSGLKSPKITGFVALGRSELSVYALRNNPRKRFNLTVDDWKPEKQLKKGGKKISTGHYLIHSRSHNKSFC